LKKTIIVLAFFTLIFSPLILAADYGNIIPQNDKVYKDLAALAASGLIRSVEPGYFEVNAITYKETASYIYEADGNISGAKLSEEQIKYYRQMLDTYKKRFSTSYAAVSSGSYKPEVMAVTHTANSSKLDALSADIDGIEKIFPDYCMSDTSRLKITGILSAKWQDLFAAGITNFHNGAMSGSMMQVSMEDVVGDMKIGAAIDLEMKQNDPAAGTSNPSFYSTSGLLDSYDLYVKMFGWNITGGMFWEDITCLTASQGPSDRPSLFDRDQYAAESTSKDYYEMIFRNYFQSLDYRWSMHPWMGIGITNSNIFPWGDSIKLIAGKVEGFYGIPNYLYEFGTRYVHRQDLPFLYGSEWAVNFYNTSNEKIETASLGVTETDSYKYVKSDNVIGGDLKTSLFRMFKITTEFERSTYNGRYSNLPYIPYTIAGNAYYVDAFPSFLPKNFTMELKYTMIDANYTAPASGVTDTNYVALDPNDTQKVKVSSISYAADPTTQYNNMGKAEASARFAIPFGLLRLNYGVSSQNKATGSTFYSKHYILGNAIYIQGFHSNWGNTDKDPNGQYSAILNYDENRYGYAFSGGSDWAEHGASDIIATGRGGLASDNNGHEEYMVSNAVTGDTKKTLSSAVFDLRFELNRFIGFKRDALLHVYGELNGLTNDFEPVVSYDPDRLFSQNIISSTFVYNVINSVNLLGYWGMERWASRSVIPYGLDYLENMYGIGADWDVGPRTGLYFRLKNFFHKDMQVDANNFHGWQLYFELKSFF
jgi:hypothetical protein